MGIQPEEMQQRVDVAVILAAGLGTRIAGHRGRGPKPTLKILGLSLAERVVLAAIDAGVTRFLVVLGHEAAGVRSEFERVAVVRGCEISFVEASGWRQGNGTSALEGARAVGRERFLLLMADHITDPELIRRVLSTPVSAREIVLGIDRDRGHLFDSDDATKVRIDGDRISRIGKHLEPWDATDTGVFLCTGALVDGLQEAASRGGHGLSDGVAALAEKGKVRTVDVTGLSWIDVDTPAAWGEARRRMLSSLSAKPEDGFVSRWINRPVSIRISALLSSTSITPDQTTFLSFAMTLAGAALLAMGQTGLTLAGGLVVQAASILDGSDGEIARLKHQMTRRGAWLDTVLDRYGDVAVVLAISLAESRVQSGALVWLGGMAALSGFLLASYTTKEYALRYGCPYPNDLLNRIKRRDLRLFGICLGALIGHPYAAMLILGGISHACIVGILLRGWRGVAEK